MRSEASRQKTKLKLFDAKLRFALLALLRSAIFSEFKEDKLLVILTSGARKAFLASVNFAIKALFLSENRKLMESLDTV